MCIKNERERLLHCYVHKNSVHLFETSRNFLIFLSFLLLQPLMKITNVHVRNDFFE